MRSETKGIMLKAVHLLSTQNVPSLLRREKKGTTQLESPTLLLKEAEVCISMKELSKKQRKELIAEEMHPPSKAFQNRKLMC
jgi:hypothetical protein